MKTAKHKFAFIGTSCSGKTTLAYETVSRLKAQGVLADGVFNQDRKFSFPRELVETEEIAQHWMITNLIAKEIDLSLHGDTDVLICDRSPLDFMAYYCETHQDSNLRTSLWAYSRAWARTYSRIYYLQPFPFQADGKRPADEFRMRVDARLKADLALYREEGLPIVEIKREEIFNDICRTLNIVKRGARTDFTHEEARTIPRLLNVDKIAYMIGRDVDVWIITDTPENYKQLEADYLDLLRGAFGAFVPFDIHWRPNTEGLPDNYTIVARSK